MKTWIFRATPKEAMVEELLAGHYEQNRSLSWPVRQHHEEVEEGDEAYFWYEDGNGDGGIVAKADVLTRVTMRPPHLMETSMFLDVLPGPRVDVLLEEIRLTEGGGRISRALLLAHTKLRLLPFLRRDDWSEWRLDDVEARDLETLWVASSTHKLRLY